MPANTTQVTPAKLRLTADILLVAGIAAAAWICAFALLVKIGGAGPNDLIPIVIVSTVCSLPALMISSAVVLYRRARISN
jgi:hypothetical protein